eukprot:jgi/Bigna1/71068/fgenesh1_pg.14_\
MDYEWMVSDTLKAVAYLFVAAAVLQLFFENTKRNIRLYRYAALAVFIGEYLAFSICLAFHKTLRLRRSMTPISTKVIQIGAVATGSIFIASFVGTAVTDSRKWNALKHVGLLVAIAFTGTYLKSLVTLNDENSNVPARNYKNSRIGGNKRTVSNTWQPSQLQYVSRPSITRPSFKAEGELQRNNFSEDAVGTAVIPTVASTASTPTTASLSSPNRANNICGKVGRNTEGGASRPQQRASLSSPSLRGRNSSPKAAATVLHDSKSSLVTPSLLLPPPILTQLNLGAPAAARTATTTTIAESTAEVSTICATTTSTCSHSVDTRGGGFIAATGYTAAASAATASTALSASKLSSSVAFQKNNSLCSSITMTRIGRELEDGGEGKINKNLYGLNEVNESWTQIAVLKSSSNYKGLGLSMARKLLCLGVAAMLIMIAVCLSLAVNATVEYSAKNSYSESFEQERSSYVATSDFGYWCYVAVTICYLTYTIPASHPIMSLCCKN